MKKLFAMILAIVLVLSLAACGGNSDDSGNTGTSGNAESAGKVESSGNTESAGSTENSGDSAPAKNLQTVEMTVEASGLEELTKVVIGAPESMTVEETGWSVRFTDEKQDVEVEAYLLNDYDTYSYNQQYAQEEYEGYGEQKFGDFDGYYYISESGYYVEVYVYLGCVAEIDDVYLSFSISALEGETSHEELFELQDVQTILASAVYYPAQEEAA